MSQSEGILDEKVDYNENCGEEVMRKYKAYIYGAGYRYNKLSVHLHRVRNQLSILGVITTTRPKYKKIDSYACFSVDAVRLQDADFIIIAVDNWKPIYQLLKERGIEDERILRSNPFELPYFQLDDYLELKKSKVTILSNYCLGGILYKKLGLEQLSPTINAFCTTENYYEFVENYEKYLSCDMEILEEDKMQDALKIGEMFASAPRGMIHNQVEWVFNHDVYIEKAVDRWNEKRKKVNMENIVVLKTIFSDEDAYRFENLNVEKKLGFYYKDLGLKHVLYCPEWKDQEVRDIYASYFVGFVIDRATDTLKYYKNVDWIRFLLGKEDYIRE